MAEYEKFTIDKVSDISIQLDLVDPSGNAKNLTGYDAVAKMKRNYSSDSSTDFTIAIVPTEGTVTLSLTNTQTDALKVGNYVYDVEISYVDENAATIVERILEGKIRVSPSVSTS